MADELHLVKVPLRVAHIAAAARRYRTSLRDLDEGYLVHCLLRSLWRDTAPSPFVLKGRGRVLDAWGYASVDAATLIDAARTFGDPYALAAIADVNAVTSRPMPIFEPGRRVGFLLRACPVVRMNRPGYRKGAEVDAFLARCAAVGPEGRVEREAVYREWLASRLDATRSGARVERISLAAVSRDRLVRRTQGAERLVRRLERPDVHFEGEMLVQDGRRLLDSLRRGVGRHRAFGFGALILVPPGASYPH
jgi:CRISPR system Cascade subunit CasE